MVSARGAEPDEKSVVSIVNAIIEEAVKSNTSDIHIEPMRDKSESGTASTECWSMHKELPVKMGPPLSSCLKIMARADIAERRRHQGGRNLIRKLEDRRRLDLRISFYCDGVGRKDRPEAAQP